MSNNKDNNKSKNYNKSQKSPKLSVGQKIATTLVILAVIAPWKEISNIKDDIMGDNVATTIEGTEDYYSDETIHNPDKESVPEDITDQTEQSIKFRNDETWQSHFDKHKDEFSFNNKEEYLQGVNEMLKQADLLTKKDDDGDDLYYRESTNEFAVVSTDGYLRTYFKPTDGIEYFNRK